MPDDIFNPKRYQNRHFWTTYQSFFVHVVIEPRKVER
jgi:hypothetical protein